jgi:hypothetical protein
MAISNRLKRVKNFQTKFRSRLVAEAIMKFPFARGVKSQADYTFSYKKGKGEWKNNVSTAFFNLRVKSGEWIEKSKKDLEILGLL